MTCEPGIDELGVVDGEIDHVHDVCREVIVEIGPSPTATRAKSTVRSDQVTDDWREVIIEIGPSRR